MSRPPQPSGIRRPGKSALRLGHAHLRVRDLDISLPFYREILGLALSERVGRFAFLATGAEHHCIALEEVGLRSLRPARLGLGVAHVAFEAQDLATFATMRKTLALGGIPIVSRNNGISWTIRFKDPDGNEIEVYVDRRESPNGRRLWGGRWHGPLRSEDEFALKLLSSARNVRGRNVP